MVNEVEFSEFLEFYSDEARYLEPVCNEPLLFGKLSDEGKILTVNTNVAA